MDLELKQALDALGSEHKTALSGLKTQLEEVKTGLANVQKQSDAIEVKMGKPGSPGAGGGVEDGLKAIRKAITEHKEAFDRHGRIRFEVPTLLPEGKSTILSTNLTSSEPSRGVQGAGRFPYRLRSLFRSVPCDLPTIGVLRSVTESISPLGQTEGQAKAESTMTFELVPVPIQTVAHFVNFSKQALDDLDGFEAFINATLIWGLERKAEAELISGDGTGVHLTGLTTDAETFDTSILAAADGWNTVDVLGAAAVQLKEAGWSPNFAVVSPRKWFQMVSLKDDNGQYVLNSPRTSMGEQAYDLTIVPSDQMSGSSFLVGDSSKATIRQRMQTTFEISREHSDNFTKNMCTALCEERFGLQILRPDAFVTGTLNSSPA